ncbi:hypothetical protein B0H13DRAFT_1979400 [Mycena leptocephala]|nr:hypothetical protein B0H13DRAFT_1979400 [Mycena leptocephala]
MHIASPPTWLGYSKYSIQRRFSHRVLPSTRAIAIHPHATSIQFTRAHNTHAVCKNPAASSTPAHATAASSSTAHTVNHNPAARPLRPAAYLRAFRFSMAAHSFPSSHRTRNLRTTQQRLSTHCAILRARDVRTRRAFHAVAPFSVVHIRVCGRASKLRPPAVNHNESR